MPRDDQRARVYAAEQFVRTLFDRVHEHGNGTVEFFGANITLPPEARFASVDSVRRYVDDVLAHPSVQKRWPTAEPLTVRARRGVTAAHYEYDGNVATVAVPDRAHSPSLRSPSETTWALRELVVLHEIAHHLSRAEPAHGPDFVATFCELTDAVMGPEVGHVLRVVYAKEGVR